MVIRKEQMQAFELNATKSFEDRVYIHLTRWFPNHCELVGEAQMRQVIQTGWKKANTYRFTAACCVQSYIEFMCLLGSGFDTDVLLPWAAEILNDDNADQLARGDRLHQKTWEYIDHVAKDYRDDKGRPTTARFMGDLRELRHDRDDVGPPLDSAPLLESLRMQIERLFPSKCRYVGETNVRESINSGAKNAERYGITAWRGVILFASMGFVLGSGFDEDPLLPWSSSTLRDPSISDQRKRADKLFAQGVSFLNRWWELSSRTGEQRRVLG